MNTEMNTDITIERTAVVASPVGLHARPAKAVAAAAADQQTVVLVGIDGKDPVDARSLLSLLAFGVQHGDTVTLSAAGEGAQQAVDALAAVIEEDHSDGS